jgi:hypothetical protein
MKSSDRNNLSQFPADIAAIVVFPLILFGLFLIPLSGSSVRIEMAAMALGSFAVAIYLFRRRRSSLYLTAIAYIALGLFGLFALFI